MFKPLLYSSLAALSACASINAVPLTADGTSALPGAEKGFRYYLPRPYLLVTELPATASAASGPKIVNPPGPPAPKGFKIPPGAAPGGKGGAGPGGGDGGAATAGADGSDSSQKNTPQQTGQASNATTNSGFSASTPTYSIKLIYLPDYSRPMAVTMSTGMFGTASIQLTLQDGWMLTNVSANWDNSKLADVMTSVLQAIAGGSSGGATTAAGATAGKAKGGAPGAAPTGQQPVDRILAPGLYAFDYSFNQSRVQSVCAVAYFDSNGSSHPTTDKDPGACGPDVSRPQASPSGNLPTQSP